MSNVDKGNGQSAMRLTWLNRLTAVTALGVFVLGLCVLWGVVGTEAVPERRCLFSEAAVVIPEGSSYHWQPSLWPPGTRCTYKLPDGSVTVTVKPILAGEWLGLGLFSIVSGIVIGFIWSRCKRFRSSRR